MAQHWSGSSWAFRLHSAILSSAVKALHLQDTELRGNVVCHGAAVTQTDYLQILPRGNGEQPHQQTTHRRMCTHTQTHRHTLEKDQGTDAGGKLKPLIQSGWIMWNVSGLLGKQKVHIRSGKWWKLIIIVESNGKGPDAMGWDCLQVNACLEDRNTIQNMVLPELTRYLLFSQ